MGFEITVDEVLDEFVDSETFDVLEFVEGTNTPQDEITLYTDADAAKKILVFLKNEKDKAEKEDPIDNWSLAEALPDENELILSEAELTALHERLVASGLTFKLKGLAPKALEAVENNLKATHDYKQGAENAEYNKALDLKVIADTIVGVRNAKGQKDPKKWTPERVEAFMSTLYPSEQGKLFTGVANANYLGAIFDAAVTADF